MGIVLTKYEDSENNNIKFDLSKFDYSTDGDTSPADIAQDFNDILLEVGDVFYVKRQTDTTDSMGTISDVSESQFRIYAYIQDISKKDRMIHDMGLAVPGNRILYLKPSYTITSGGVDTEYVVKEGDIFIDRNSNRWRVIKIVKEPYFETQQIYKRAIVQSIGLEGSE